MERVEFDEFYRTHWRDAARWAAAVVGRVDIGEELAQDVFSRLATKYAGLENPTAYLRTAVVNAGRSWLRSDGRSRAREDRAGSDGPGVARDGSGVEVLALLDGLPERQRLVVILRYWADWADDEIATALGCPLSTVRSLARRGLERVRKEMTA